MWKRKQNVADVREGKREKGGESILTLRDAEREGGREKKE